MTTLLQKIFHLASIPEDTRTVKQENERKKLISDLDYICNGKNVFVCSDGQNCKIMTGEQRKFMTNVFPVYMKSDVLFPTLKQVMDIYKLSENSEINYEYAFKCAASNE
jgi:hypothetical protein